MSEMLQPWEEIKINESEPEHFHEKKNTVFFSTWKKGFLIENNEDNCDFHKSL